MIKRISHIGVAVKDLEQSGNFYSKVLDLKISDSETHGDLTAAFVPVGDTRIELLNSSNPANVISKFIDKKGEGVHHIAYEVDDIEKTIAEVMAQGIEMIDKKPREGAHNSKIAFINPKYTYGILVELVEPEKK